MKRETPVALLYTSYPWVQYMLRRPWTQTKPKNNTQILEPVVKRKPPQCSEDDKRGGENKNTRRSLLLEILRPEPDQRGPLGEGSLIPRFFRFFLGLRPVSLLL